MTVNPYRGLYHLAVAKYMQDMEVFGFRKGDRWERFSYYMIWFCTITWSLCLTMFAFVVFTLLLMIGDFLWHIITTY